MHSHYNQGEEKERLNHGTGLLEKERTRQIISRYLNKNCLDILDVGGAAGIYSFWLAEAGHKVHLLDVMDIHIHQAKEFNSDAAFQLAEIRVGDAMDLSSYSEDSFDIVLMLGPLYHLTEAEARVKAMREAVRVLRKNGKLIAAGINRFASLYDGLSRGLIDDPYFVEILKQDLKNGQHRNPKNHPDYFTTTIFQLPAEMKREAEQAGLQILDILPVEGAGWMADQFEERWNNEKRRNQLLELLELTERDPDLLHITQHYLLIAEK